MDEAFRNDKRKNGGSEEKRDDDWLYSFLCRRSCDGIRSLSLSRICLKLYQSDGSLRGNHGWLLELARICRAGDSQFYFVGRKILESLDPEQRLSPSTTSDHGYHLISVEIKDIRPSKKATQGPFLLSIIDGNPLFTSVHINRSTPLQLIHAHSWHR